MNEPTQDNLDAQIPLTSASQEALSPAAGGFGRDIQTLELEHARRPSSDAFIALCQAYIKQKRYVEAVLLTKKAIKNTPDDFRGRYWLSRVYFEQGKLPLADIELKTLLDQFPSNADALILLAEIYKQQARKSEAILLIKKLAQMRPLRPEVTQLMIHYGLNQEIETPPPAKETAAPSTTKAAIKAAKSSKSSAPAAVASELDLYAQEEGKVLVIDDAIADAILSGKRPSYSASAAQSRARANESASESGQTMKYLLPLGILLLLCLGAAIVWRFAL